MARQAGDPALCAGSGDPVRGTEEAEDRQGVGGPEDDARDAAQIAGAGRPVEQPGTDRPRSGGVPAGGGADEKAQLDDIPFWRVPWFTTKELIPNGHEDD